MKPSVAGAVLCLAFFLPIARAQDKSHVNANVAEVTSSSVCASKALTFTFDESLKRWEGINGRKDTSVMSSYEPTGCCCIKVGSDPPSCSCCESQRLCSDTADKTGGTATWTEGSKCP
jgi:hypothetical protein